MAMQILSGSTPDGRRVEYRQYPNQGVSLAESKAHVVVGGKTVHRGWSSDGETYRVYQSYILGTVF